MLDIKPRLISLLPYTAYKKLKSLQLRIRKLLYGRKTLKVVVGSGGVFQNGWVATNKETVDITNENDWRRYFKEGSIDIILGEHVLEHLSLKNGTKAIKIMKRFLKEGGYIRIAVPDRFHPDPKYIELNDVIEDQIALNEYDYHHVFYDYKSLSKIFQEEGFEIKLLEFYDENGTFHFHEWDPKGGLIYRSERFKFLKNDVSIGNMSNYTSLIIDAIKQ